jgi:hypothetical protein
MQIYNTIQLANVPGSGSNVTMATAAPPAYPMGMPFLPTPVSFLHHRKQFCADIVTQQALYAAWSAAQPALAACVGPSLKEGSQSAPLMTS